MLNYTLRQLEYLIACIDHKSIAGAANALNVSQPTISVAINKLEDQFGVQLLLRHHSQGVSPTLSAENILQSARSLLAHADDLQKDAMATGTTITGEIRLGSFSTLASSVLPGLIGELQAKFEGINAKVREGTQDKILKDLIEGQIDLALLYDVDLPAGLRLISLAEMTPYVALPQGHPLARQRDIALADLVDEPMISLNISPSRDYFLGLFKDVGLKPQIAHSSPSIELVRGMVGHGLGYSILVTRPEGDVTYDGKKLAIRPLRDKARKSKIVLATRSDMRPTRLILAFEEVAKAHFET